MTPKEKAKELVFRMDIFLINDNNKYYAKQCALIAVYEILKEYWSHDTKRRDWWEEVKQEIENI